MAKKVHRRTIHRSGVRTLKIGVPPVWVDFYYNVMAMSWRRYILYVIFAFLTLNAIFGIIYSLIGGISNLEKHSFLAGFYFSVETLATVGYGHMAPMSPLAHLVTTFEVLTGIFFSASITGTIIARLTRPQSGIVFARNAVVDNFEGKRALMVRLASTHMHPLADMKGQISWIERIKLQSGHEFGQMKQLELRQANFTRLDLSWTLIHFIEEGSDFANALAGNCEYRLYSSVSGHDTLLGTQAHGSQSYGKENIFIDHKYVDVIGFSDQMRSIDLTMLDHTEAHIKQPLSGDFSMKDLGHKS